MHPASLFGYAYREGATNVIRSLAGTKYTLEMVTEQFQTIDQRCRENKLAFDKSPTTAGDKEWAYLSRGSANILRQIGDAGSFFAADCVDRVLGGLTGLEDSLKGCIELLIERSVEIIDPTAEEQPSIAFSVYAHPAPPFEHTLIVPYSLALPSPDAAEKATQLPAAILEVLKCWSDAIEAKLDYEVSSNGWTASGRPPGWRLQPQNRPKERADREADFRKAQSLSRFPFRTMNADR